MSASGAPGTPRAGEQHPERPSGWRTPDILRTAALVAAVYLALKLLWVAHPVFILGFLGVLFGLALGAGADWLARWRVPRSIAVLGQMLAFLGALFAVGAVSAPILQEQFGELETRLPDAVREFESWINRRQSGLLGELLRGNRRTAAPAPAARDSRPPSAQGAPSQAPGPAPAGQGAAPPGAPEPGGAVASLRAELMAQLSGLGRYVSGLVTSTLTTLAGLLLIIFVAVYVALDPRTYSRGLVLLFPRVARPRAREVMAAMAAMLRRWLITQLWAMLAIGVVTTIALVLLDVQAALALGVLAGLLEFIPIVGPILSAVPAVAMGFLDSPQTALYVLLAYVAIQQVESNLLVPLLMKQGLDLPPVLTILGQALMSLVFGFLGLVVAVPVLSAAMVALKLLYMEDVLGEEMTLPGDQAVEPVPKPA